MSALENLYSAILHSVRPALPLLTRGEGKLARGIRGRAGALERAAAWAREHRDPERPLVWVHAPSVGEGLQARAVLEEFRSARPEAQVAYTFFSPSAEPFARSVPADFVDYLPLDLRGHVRRLFDALRPDVVAFTRSEVWPNVTREAELRGIPVVLLSATLPESSSRLRWPARRLLRPAHERLARVGAISAADAERFRRLGVPEARATVMGDSRMDQVWTRAHRSGPNAARVRELVRSDRITLVAGSTWPEDEDRLTGAFMKLAGAANALRLVIVPHEPTEDHLGRLERRLAECHLLAVRLSSASAGLDPDPIVIVDEVGLLGDLYGIADVAYVGGGFGRAGLHSVLEPAAYGVPVLFGPRHANAREAAELVAAGGAASVGSEGELLQRIRDWRDDPAERRAAGARSRAYVQRGLGAASRGARLLTELITQS